MGGEPLCFLRFPFPFRPATSPAYALLYRSDLHVLFLRWLRTTSLAEAQDSYRAALALAQQHGCAHWLLDARRGGPIAIAETNWLADEFFPAAAARLAPRPLVLAVFSSPARIEQVHHDAAVVSPVARALAPERPYLARVFADEGAAVGWLMDPSAQARALAAATFAICHPRCPATGKTRGAPDERTAGSTPAARRTPP